MTRYTFAAGLVTTFCTARGATAFNALTRMVVPVVFQRAKIDRTLWPMTARRLSCLASTTPLPEYGNPSYGITKKLPPGTSFDAAIYSVTASLKEHGFGVLTKIDMRETMQKKLDADLGRPFVILGACNPKLAHAAILKSPSVGLFLPCNIAVAEDPDGSIVVSTVSPEEMFKVADDPGIEPLAEEVQGIMEKVIEGL